MVITRLSTLATRESTYSCKVYRGRDRMVVGFTTTYSISVYQHKNCEFESRSW